MQEVQVVNQGKKSRIIVVNSLFLKKTSVFFKNLLVKRSDKSDSKAKEEDLNKFAPHSSDTVGERKNKEKIKNICSKLILSIFLLGVLTLVGAGSGIAGSGLIRYHRGEKITFNNFGLPLIVLLGFITLAFLWLVLLPHIVNFPIKIHFPQSQERKSSSKKNEQKKKEHFRQKLKNTLHSRKIARIVCFGCIVGIGTVTIYFGIKLLLNLTLWGIKLSELGFLCILLGWFFAFFHVIQILKQIKWNQEFKSSQKPIQEVGPKRYRTYKKNCEEKSEAKKEGKQEKNSVVYIANDRISDAWVPHPRKYKRNSVKLKQKIINQKSPSSTPINPFPKCPLNRNKKPDIVLYKYTTHILTAIIILVFVGAMLSSPNVGLTQDDLKCEAVEENITYNYGEAGNFLNWTISQVPYGGFTYEISNGTHIVQIGKITKSTTLLQAVDNLLPGTHNFQLNIIFHQKVIASDNINVEVVNDQPTIISIECRNQYEATNPNNYIQWDVVDEIQEGASFKIWKGPITRRELMQEQLECVPSNPSIFLPLKNMEPGAYIIYMEYKDGLGGIVASQKEIEIVENLDPIVTEEIPTDLEMGENLTVHYSIEDYVNGEGKYTIYFEANQITNGSWANTTHIATEVNTSHLLTGSYEVILEYTVKTINTSVFPEVQYYYPFEMIKTQITIHTNLCPEVSGSTETENNTVIFTWIVADFNLTDDAFYTIHCQETEMERELLEISRDLTKNKAQIIYSPKSFMLSSKELSLELYVTDGRGNSTSHILVYSSPAPDPHSFPSPQPKEESTPSNFNGGYILLFGMTLIFGLAQAGSQLGKKKRKILLCMFAMGVMIANVDTLRDQTYTRGGSILSFFTITTSYTTDSESGWLENDTRFKIRVYDTLQYNFYLQEAAIVETRIVNSLGYEIPLDRKLFEAGLQSGQVEMDPALYQPKISEFKNLTQIRNSYNFLPNHNYTIALYAFLPDSDLELLTGWSEILTFEVIKAKSTIRFEKVGGYDEEMAMIDYTNSTTDSRTIYL